MASAITLCGVAVAHPGHGAPIEEAPLEPDTGETDTGTGSTGTGSTGDVSTDTSSSTHSGSSSSSSSPDSASMSTSDSRRGVQSDGSSTGGSQVEGSTGEKETAGVVDSSINLERVFSDVSSTSQSTGNYPGGPVAMIGLMVVTSLIAMSFPYKEGGILSNLQIRLFGQK